MTRKDKEYPTEHIGSPGHAADKPMSPWDPKINIDGLSNEYTELFYTYNRRPRYCKDDTDCGIYLFCMKSDQVCVSKIRYEGECTGFVQYGAAPCEKGVCQTKGRKAFCSVLQEDNDEDNDGDNNDDDDDDDDLYIV